MHPLYSQIWRRFLNGVYSNQYQRNTGNENALKGVARTYIEVAFSTEASSSARFFRFFRVLSFALKMAYPAAVSVRMKTMAFYPNLGLLVRRKIDSVRLKAAVKWEGEK